MPSNHDDKPLTAAHVQVLVALLTSVARVLRLTALASNVVEPILAGQRPRHLDLQALWGRHDVLPREWDLQRDELECATR